ncbi:MAG: PQQ-binding-like beta-propeller repeat protein [Myxococcota bacterium]
MRLAFTAVVPLLLAACNQPIELVWKVDLGAPSVSTPLVTESFIAVGTEVGLTVLEPNGKIRCQYETHRDVISAPKTDGERIYFGSTNYMVYAVTPTCQEAWKVPTGDRVKSDPLVGDGTVYFSSYDGHLYALDAASGARRWVFPAAANVAPAEPTTTPPAVAPAASAKAKARAKRRGKRAEPAAVAATPAPDKAATPAPFDVGDFSYSSPVLHEGVIYLGNLDHHLYAIDAKSGRLLWRWASGGAVTSTPLVDGGLIFFGSNDGNLYAMDLASHAIRWKLNTHDWVNSSPRVADGVVYVGSNDRHVYAVRISDGTPLWAHEIVGPAIAIPAIYKNLCIAAGASGDGALYALQRDTGAEFWKFTSGGKIESDPVIVGDRLYVSSADGTLYVFKINATQAAS